MPIRRGVSLPRQPPRVNILHTRENTHSVGVYFTGPDGNGLEVYYEEPGGYRQSWEGQYARKLEAE